jgi:hypothetical protein
VILYFVKTFVPVSILVFGFFLVSRTALAEEEYQPSTWAVEKIEIANKAGLTPDDFGNSKYTESITRRDFSELLINSCRVFDYPLPKKSKTHPFTDTQDENVEKAYILGLINGTGEGIFSPDLPLTREMAVVMLGKLRLLFQSEQLMDENEAEEIIQRYAKDGDKLAGWAKRHMADAYSRGIIAGSGDGSLNPKDNITREQAVILVLNLLAYCDPACFREAGVRACVLPAPSGMKISEYYQNGEVKLTWGEVPAASAYEVRIYKNGALAYTERTEDHSLDFRTSSQNNNLIEEDNIIGNVKQTTRAVLEVIPLDRKGNPSVFSLKREFIVLAQDRPREKASASRSAKSVTRFRNAEEALPFMKDISVQVWQLSSGKKITGTITIKVHPDVAEDVKKIFAEIYNGKEKFPIKSCSGYADRGGTSQHNFGLAIDINPDENYFISRSGTIKAGKLWKPGENPYSILPDGDVVRAFKKYGWHWSPDMHWSSGADYMHFSLTGT